MTGAVKAINDISQYTGVTAQSFNSGTTSFVLDADGDDITHSAMTTHVSYQHGASSYCTMGDASAAVNSRQRLAARVEATTQPLVSGTLEAFSNKGFNISSRCGGHCSLTYFAASYNAARFERHKCD